MLNIFWAELRRTTLLLRRYWLSTVSGLLGMVLVFMGIVVGARFVSGVATFGDRLEALIVGYLLWSLTILVFSEVAGDLQTEAQVGTLEQVCLSVRSLTSIFMLRSFSRVFWTLVMNAAVLLLLCLLTGTTLNLSWMLLPALALTLLSVYGLAFMLGAVALGGRRIGQLANLLGFALLFLIMTPFEQTMPHLLTLLSGLPLVPGAALLREILVHGSGGSAQAWLLLLLNAGLWLGLGAMTFQRADRQVRQRGLLTSY